MKDVAKIILINSKGKLLFVLRDNKPGIPYPNHWAEIGGAIESGEMPLEALIREIKEEISCEVKDIKFLGKRYDPKFDCKVFMFKGEISDNLEQIKLYEGEKLGFFNFEDLNKLPMPPQLKEFVLKNKEKILM